MGFLTMGPPANMPNPIDLPNLDHIIDLWQFSDDAMEVSSFFQALFTRLPAYFLAFFAISLCLLVVPLVFRLVSEIW